MAVNLCTPPQPACLFDLFLHTTFKVISTVSPWMPQSYKSEENGPVILVNNARDELSLKKTPRILEGNECCIRMRTGPIYQSPWLALSFWPTLEVHIHVHMLNPIPEPNKGGHANSESLSHSKMSNAIFFTHTAISQAVLVEAFA